MKINFRLVDNQDVISGCPSQMCEYLEPNLEAKPALFTNVV